MTFRTLILFYLILSLMASCHDNRFDNEFLNRHGDENFSAHVNTLTYLRGLDENGNLIYFFSDLSDTCEAPYIVRVNKASNKSVNVETKLRKIPCGGVFSDTLVIKNLVDRFLKYKIGFLKVDRDSIIYVNVESAEKADLVRLPKSVFQEQFKGKLKYLKNQWYSWQE